MNTYTIVLKRSDELDTRLGDDVDYYVAVGVLAVSPKEAVLKARQEVFDADKKDLRELHPNIKFGTNYSLDVYEGDFKHTLREYSLVVAFEGAHHPILYSFQDPT